MSEQLHPESTAADTRDEIQLGELQEFDMKYFKQLEGQDGWIAIGQDNCKNQRYFTAVDSLGNKLGVVGVYDTNEETNITHTVVDPKFRGQGLAAKMELQLADKLGLSEMTMTVDLDNDSSLCAMAKMPDIQRTSDEAYEAEFHKVRFEWKLPEEE